MNIEFLDIDEICEIHAYVLQRYGGLDGIRSRELLESAIAQPQATFGGHYLHEDIYMMAAAYAFHISQNQPFIDGNKRTGLLAALTFLDSNGITVPDCFAALYPAMLAMADHTMDKAAFAETLQKILLERSRG